MAAIYKKPRRTQYSRVEALLGTVRERDAGNGQSVRMIKIRIDGPAGQRWIAWARWWWEQNRGPVPARHRICHVDGNLLNDEPENLVCLSPGEVFNLYHKLDPEMSRRNRAACGRSAAVRNVRAARTRRESEWLLKQWYAVDVEKRTIHRQPRHNRWVIYRNHGFQMRHAEYIARYIDAARGGNSDAAAIVIEQAERLNAWWRWVRSSSLGWPAINCMTACVMHELAKAGSLVPTPDLVDRVRDLRRLLDWKPYTLHRPVLSSLASKVRSWIGSIRDVDAGALWWITDAGREARQDAPRIVPIRGSHLQLQEFKQFDLVGDAPHAVRERRRRPESVVAA